MHSFITQYRKAKTGRKMLLFENSTNRWLVTNKNHWQNWATLIKDFRYV